MPDRQRSQPSASARALALGALALAVVVIAYIVLSSGSSYRVRLLFSDASGLVTGDQVMIGPSSVGSVSSVTLTPGGQAAVVVSARRRAPHRSTRVRSRASRRTDSPASRAIT